MEVVAGIDLGNSNSVIAVLKNGKVSIVPNSIGDSITPSVVEILDDKILVGEETIIQKADKEHTIIEVKRLIGKNFSKIQNKKNINYSVIVDKDDNLKIKVKRNGKDEFFTPKQIMTLIFKKLINNASDFVGTKVKKAVITYPANFNYAQRTDISESANDAGIEVLKFITEPTAAALAYVLGNSEDLKSSLLSSILKEENKKIRKILIFDLGGGTFDVSILTFKNDDFNVITTLGDSELGGRDFDNKLVDFCLKDFCVKMNICEEDIRKDPNALKRLKIQCEKAKKKLTDNKSTYIIIYNFFKNNNLRLEITRETFNILCEDLYQKIFKILDKALLEAKYKENDLDEVVLIGGSSRIPKIKQLLEDKFSSKKIKDKINQDEAVAIGAAWQAYKLSEPSMDLKITDITQFPLGVGVVSENVEEQKKGKVMSYLIPKNSKIPKEKTQIYKTITDDQEYFDVNVYSGENRFCKDNELLRHFIIDKLPKGPAGTVKLSLSFLVDENGILTINYEVSSKDKSSNTQASSMLKKTIKFSIYEDESQDKNSKLKYSTKKVEKKKLEEIKKETDFIKEKQESFKSLQDNEDKIDSLNDLIESCLKIISIYESLNANNDSGCLDEKLFEYTKLLFKFYSQTIILENNNQNIENIVTKIKEILPKFINDDIENLIGIFNELKIKKPKIYIDILLFCVDLLYKEGDKILEEKKQYSRYYSKKFYIKAKKIKSYIDNDEKLKAKMNSKLDNKYKELKIYKGKVEEIDSFVESIKNLIQQKNIPYLSNKTGFTRHNEQIEKSLGNLYEENNVYFLLDILQEMAISLKNEVSISEVEAYCLATIIKINFSINKNYDFKLYENLIGRIEYIYGKLYEEENEDEELKEPIWHQEFTQLTEEIKKKKKEMEKKIDNEKEIKEIKDTFSQFKKDKKLKEFLLYLLDKYPYIKYDPSKRKSFEEKSFKELFRTMFHEYHSDNYNGRDDYSIYNAIYELFVEMENYL